MSAIITTHDSICLEIIHSVYKEKVKYETMPDGELFPVKAQTLKKELKVKKWFKKEAITSVEEYVTTKHTIAKNRSIVFDKFSGKFYATFHAVDDIMQAIEPQAYKNQIGFLYDTKVHSGRPQIHEYKKRG